MKGWFFMAKCYMFLTDRFETVEALAVVDILRRAGVLVVTVSVTGNKNVVSAQNIMVCADEILNNAAYDDADVVFLPGGPGTGELEKVSQVCDITKRQYESGKIVAAICAAPSILGHMGMLIGRDATCFPGYEDELKGARCTGERVVVSENVVTGRGMGTAIDMGLKLVELLCGKEVSEKLSKSTQYT